MTEMRRSRREFLKTAGASAAVLGMGAVARPGWGKQEARGVAGPDSLRSHAAARGVLVGCAVVPELLENEPQYASVVAEQASILVAENAMKWEALRPAADRFDFSGADATMRFAEAHGQKVRGHNLCWHLALPLWFATTVTKENARDFLTKHIRTVAGRYAGKLQAWDVVNEAIDPKSGRADDLRKSPWLELIGPKYIDVAFRTAREADSTALLAYNEYGIELDTPDQVKKRDAVATLVKGMKARGVPIDAVGVQSHLAAGDPLPGAGLLRFVRELNALGLQVFVTEMDVNDRKVAGTIAERDAAVAKIYRDYLGMMFGEPNVNVALTWGITDRYTWLNRGKATRADGQPERPLLFDANYRPAPAFFAERAAIDTRQART